MIIITKFIFMKKKIQIFLRKQGGLFFTLFGKDSSSMSLSTLKILGNSSPSFLKNLRKKKFFFDRFSAIFFLKLRKTPKNCPTGGLRRPIFKMIFFVQNIYKMGPNGFPCHLGRIKNQNNDF